METIQEQPTASAAVHMDCIADNARNLSDAIKAANRAGISVSIQVNESETGELFQIVYSF